MKIKTLFLTFAAFLFIVPIFAQDTLVAPVKDTLLPIVVPDPFPLHEGVGAMVTWILNNWTSVLGVLSAVVLLLEVLLSIVPTKQNLSILTGVRRFLDNARFLKFITGNRASGGQVFKVDSKIESK